ncbi:MAG: hypothetical protein DI535_26435 [Citrobacter freundii]|nr:MAG: hypothetical protein DI535_26435 [Citrobacter freundii]
MKKWRRVLQWLFIRHVAAFEEELYPELVHQPVADAEAIRLSVRRHFRVARPDQPYLLAYDADYDTIVEEFYQEGWVIQLKVEEDGGMAYYISPSRSIISARV